MKTTFSQLSRPLVLMALLCFNLVSCVSTEREVSSPSVDPRSTYRPPTTGDRTRVSINKVLNTVSAKHAFSSAAAEDNFRLELRGPRVLTAQAHFTVLSSTGDTLRHEVMPARALLRESERATSVREQEIAILQGMNNFFAPTRFSQPAIPAGAEQPAEVDTKTWAALRADPATVGFDYTGPGGTERRLAFARKLNKAVIIAQ